jgi:hypothetical protein
MGNTRNQSRTTPDLRLNTVRVPRRAIGSALCRPEGRGRSSQGKPNRDRGASPARARGESRLNMSAIWLESPSVRISGLAAVGAPAASGRKNLAVQRRHMRRQGLRAVGGYPTLPTPPPALSWRRWLQVETAVQRPAPT